VWEGWGLHGRTLGWNQGTLNTRLLEEVGRWPFQRSRGVQPLPESGTGMCRNSSVGKELMASRAAAGGPPCLPKHICASGAPGQAANQRVFTQGRWDGTRASKY
jgi:hypothetical protein